MTKPDAKGNHKINHGNQDYHRKRAHKGHLKEEPREKDKEKPHHSHTKIGDNLGKNQFQRTDGRDKRDSKVPRSHSRAMTIAVNMMPTRVTISIISPGRKNQVLELASLNHMRGSRTTCADPATPFCRLKKKLSRFQYRSGSSWPWLFPPHRERQRFLPGPEKAWM